MIVAANRADVTQLAAVLEAKVVCQVLVEGRGWVEENLCADAGYFGKPARELICGAGYVPHVVPRGEERKLKEAAWEKAKESGEAPEQYRARRWVVEASHSWFNQFRKLTIRHEKQVKNWLALHHLAACVIALRKIQRPDGSNLIYG